MGYVPVGCGASIRCVAEKGTSQDDQAKYVWQVTFNTCYQLVIGPEEIVYQLIVLRVLLAVGVCEFSVDQVVFDVFVPSKSQDGWVRPYFV